MRLWAEAVLTISAFALFGVYVWHMAPKPREAVEPAVAPGEPEPRWCGEWCP